MDDDTTSWLFIMKFWILLILSIPSAICSILIFIYFYRQRTNVSVHLHIIFILVMISFLQIITDFPFVITYYHYGKVIPASNSFCLWWNWWDYSISGLLIFAMAWGSIERHFLIFHASLMSTRRKRMIFHILPTLIVCAYPVIFYFAVIILNSCENQWDYSMLLCIQPCYLIDQPALATYDFLANSVLAIAITTLANACLIFRVTRQKRLRRSSWSRQRKLAKQLLYIAIIYIIFWIPLTFNGLILTFTSSSISLDLQMNYFFFFVYMVPILLPFVSLSYLSDFTKIIFNRRKNTIGPMTRFTNTIFIQRRRCIAPLPHIT